LNKEANKIHFSVWRCLWSTSPP